MALVCREVSGSPTCTTLAGVPVKMEIYPVGTLTKLQPEDPINKIKNSAGIVIYKDDVVTENTAAHLELTRWVPASLKLDDDDSRVEWKITPIVGAAGGDAKFYKGSNKGRRVHIYGTKAGEILIEADYGWTHTAKFRAIVVDLKQIKFRVSRVRATGFQPVPSLRDIKKHIRIANLYLRQAGVKLVPDNGAEVAMSSGNSRVGDPTLPVPPPPPPSTASVTDLKVVNVKRVEPGYFDVHVNDINMARTLDVKADALNAIRVNAMNEILSIVYVHSINNPPAGGGTLGIAYLRPVNHGVAPGDPRVPSAAALAGAHTTTETLAPSTSWVAPNGLPVGSLPSPAPPLPSGVSPSRTVGLATRDGPGADPSGAPASTVTMQLMGASPSIWQPVSPATRDVNLLWGVIMDGQTHTNQDFGNTLAHEIGHVLGLRHRNGGGSDTVVWPQWENLMDGSAPSPDAQNLDVLQCKAVRFCELLFRPNAISVAPEFEPSNHRPVGVLVGVLSGVLIGAVVGAIVGAIVGFAISGGNPNAAAAGAMYGAAIGAGIGAVVGGLIGGLAGAEPDDP